MDYAGVMIEREDGKILFQLRDDNPLIANPNRWGIFGGGIEEGESAKAAAVRELKEELNLIVKEEELEHIMSVERNNTTSYIYRLKINSDVKFELHEGRDMDFFSKDEAIRMESLVPFLKALLIIL